MPFYFLHPIYLYGLLAASLPLIIHLLNRRRLRRIRFPTVKFILLSQRRVSGDGPSELAVERAGWGWGSLFADVDNDGWLDLYAPSGYYTAPAAVGTAVDT